MLVLLVEFQFEFDAGQRRAVRSSMEWFGLKLEFGTRLGGHAALPQRPAFSPDGEYIASGCMKGWLTVRTREGREVARLRVPPAGIYSAPRVDGLAWSPDGSCLAVDEHGGVVLRRPDDLGLLAEAKSIGRGLVAFGGGGTFLAVPTSDMGAYVLPVPGLSSKSLLMVLRGDFDSFSTPTLAVDPTGTLVAVADDGGSDETAMGMVTARGTPKVTLFDGANSSSLGTVESGKLTHRLEVDPFRRRLFTCTYEDVGVWSFDGQPLRRFRPYAGTFARSLAVCERFLATSPNLVSTLDLWDPMTFERLATVDLGQTSAEWISISPDGSLLLVPALPQQRDFGFRTVHVNG